MRALGVVDASEADALIYLLARYYDPATGQFTSVDPDLDETLEAAAYADGNPVSHIDPTGKAVYSDGTKLFTPFASTFRGIDSNGSLETSYNFHTSPGTFAWRYQIQPAICSGGEGAAGTSDVYNVGGKAVPKTHYGKAGRPACYNWHASFPAQRITPKGNYYLLGQIVWSEDLGYVIALFVIRFTFKFRISYV